MKIHDLSGVLKPVSQAQGLPNAHYLSDEVHGLERDALFFGGWAGLTIASRLPEPGDAVPVDFLGLPLVAIRGRDGQVRVFQNTCRHRGMILVEKAGQVGNVIRCPYHSWCYSFAGELVTTPHVGGPGQNTHKDVKREELGLIEIQSHVWMDIVFVNVSGDAAPFEAENAALIARWAEFDTPIHHGGADSHFTLDVACNWKLAVENYCESYHLPWIHPGLNSYSRLEDHYHIEEPGAYSGQGTLVYSPQPARDGRRFPDFEGLSDKWDRGAEYIAVYPNVLLGVHRDHIFAILLMPQAVDRTVEDINISYTTPEAAGDGYADMRIRNAAMWKEVFEEDIFVVEGMQRGRRGRFFDGGRFSPAMDGPTHLFHAWVADRLSDDRCAAE